MFPIESGFDFFSCLALDWSRLKEAEPQEPRARDAEFAILSPAPLFVLEFNNSPSDSSLLFLRVDYCQRGNKRHGKILMIPGGNEHRSRRYPAVSLTLFPTLICSE